MKQVLRRVIDAKGKVQVEEVAAPTLEANNVLIAVRHSLISSGTERATLQKTPLELSKLFLTDPWMRRAVLNLMSESLAQTASTVVDQLTQLREVGYSGAGIAHAVGGNVKGIAPGERVAYALAGHAEVVSVPGTLVVRVPDKVELSHACFVTVGAIALNGVRKSGARLGESVAVIAQGLIGQLTSQILLAAGCDVIGIDLSDAKLEAARAAGVRHLVNSARQDPVQAVRDLTGGRGADRVIICAQSSDPTPANQAMKMCRKQGQVTFVGIVKMELERMPFFKGELNLNFSRAYGPGIMDPRFERGEIDYPSEYIRFTARDNMAGFLDLIAQGRVSVGQFISGSWPIDQAQQAFDAIFKPQQSTVAVILDYPANDAATRHTRVENPKPKRSSEQRLNVGLIGCGNFTKSYHLPNMARNPRCCPFAVATRTGATGAHVAKRFGMEYHTTDADAIIADQRIGLVYIGTRHNLHADLAVRALKAGKHVLCEKPVAMSLAELGAVMRAARASDKLLSAGFNRRYSPHATKLKSALADQPRMMTYTVNTGRIAADHWTLDPVQGGGRLIGEADHFFDLMNFMAGGEPLEVSATALVREGENAMSQLNFFATVRYGDGSQGTLLYTDLGGSSFPRERVEVFSGGAVHVIEDYKHYAVCGSKRRTRERKKNMGHANELDVVIRAVLGEEVRGLVRSVDVERATLCSQAALRSIETGTAVRLDALRREMV